MYVGVFSKFGYFATILSLNFVFRLEQKILSVKKYNFFVDIWDEQITSIIFFKSLFLLQVATKNSIFVQFIFLVKSGKFEFYTDLQMRSLILAVAKNGNFYDFSGGLLPFFLHFMALCTHVANLELWWVPNPSFSHLLQHTEKSLVVCMGSENARMRKPLAKRKLSLTSDRLL